jgi:hypothetical protein
MIRRGKFTRVEIVILWVFAALLVVAGGTGLFLSAGQGHWRLALASLGILGIAAIYGLAARRGKATLSVRRPTTDAVT